MDVEVIDDDLGRSAGGTVARPGFDRLVAWLYAGKVGAVLCFDASRLARNGRDWHHLLELCGLVHADHSAEKGGEWLTMSEAAKALGVTNHVIRQLITTGVLPAVQVVSGAPYQIRADDLALPAIKAAVARKGRPCRADDANTLPMFPDT
jgi:excisionase family DNA binding protein